MVTIHLTDAQWAQIESDAGRTHLLNEDEVEKIARKLQLTKNLPFVNEEKEYVIFVKIVRSLDKVLYENLPNEIYASIRDVNEGIDPGEKKRLVRSLTKYVNNKIDIPYLPELAEKFIIRGFLHLIVNALLKGNKLTDLLNNEIPEEL